MLSDDESTVPSGSETEQRGEKRSLAEDYAMLLDESPEGFQKRLKDIMVTRAHSWPDRTLAQVDKHRGYTFYCGKRETFGEVFDAAYISELDMMVVPA